MIKSKALNQIVGSELQSLLELPIRRRTAVLTNSHPSELGTPLNGPLKDESREVTALGFLFHPRTSLALLCPLSITAFGK